MQRVVSERWPITADDRARIVASAKCVANSDDTRAAIRAQELLVKMEAQNQADEQERRKYDRLDEGLPTEGTAVFALEFDGGGTVERG
jgi:hypothetical protein